MHTVIQKQNYIYNLQDNFIDITVEKYFIYIVHLYPEIISSNISYEIVLDIIHIHSYPEYLSINTDPLILNLEKPQIDIQLCSQCLPKSHHLLSQLKSSLSPD